MFNKESYWKNRNNTVEIEVPDPKSKAKKPKMIKVQEAKPLRGQGVIEKPKIVPAGEQVFRTKPDGTKVEVLNAAGGYRSFGRNGQMRIMNRKQHRDRYVDRTYTAKNYDHKMEQKDDKGNKINAPHKVNEHKHELIYAPSLTNNQRMKLREMGRIDKANRKKEMVTA